jgi:YVTN family beta-propeller protein
MCRHHLGEHPRRTLLLATALTALLLASAAPAALARDVFVANAGSESVSVIDTESNLVVGSAITVGKAPVAIAITPDGRFAYVVNDISGSVSVIDTQTKQVVGSPIQVGTFPTAIAITPDGKFAYVANAGSESVSVIDTQTKQVVGSPIPVGKFPQAVAITPDGRFAYVSNEGPSNVSVIDTQINQVVGSPIPVGSGPAGIAITPDGASAFVANFGSTNILFLDVQTNQPVGSPITVGTNPHSIAITPDGASAFVANELSNNVSAVDAQTRQVVGSPISVGTSPLGIAIAPKGRFAYVANYGSNSVSVIDTQTKFVSSPIMVGTHPEGIAITPDQPPHASFSDPFTRPGVPVAFDASASCDPDGSIARYDWTFGDAAQALNAGPTPRHAYAKPGTYTATLTLTDNEGCSTSLIFTGQTAYCNGSPSASQTQAVKVAYPGVRVKCPKRAKPKGCKFKLQAVSKKNNGKAESAVAKARAKAGKTAVVSLVPKKQFNSKLAGAKKILVKQTLKIKGSHQTSFLRLKVVQ